MFLFLSILFSSFYSNASAEYTGPLLLKVELSRSSEAGNGYKKCEIYKDKIVKTSVVGSEKLVQEIQSNLDSEIQKTIDQCDESTVNEKSILLDAESVLYAAVKVSGDGISKRQITLDSVNGDAGKHTENYSKVAKILISFIDIICN